MSTPEKTAQGPDHGPVTCANTDQVPWLETSPADFDRRRLVKGYRPPRDDQPGLFYVPAPTAERKPAQDVQLDGQGSLFGNEGS